MSQSENVDIEIENETLTFSYKQTSGIPVGAGSKEENNRQINIKIENKGEKYKKIEEQLEKQLEKQLEETPKEDKYDINLLFAKQTIFESNVIMGFSVFLMCATFGLVAKHI